ncbi:HlyD family secretion protein [Pseudoduganella ginsengisoli]|uniref:Efflux RND transporter periplasmic adaptor subunit n=1 Tax=Pseudoduganella ginsengisoli TaxID=1462440 RepID=A0A6L6Q3R2_9BURK|nr:efflux RND transporter periplasmic adaptor subunit [Pseudoduganella ginsengisoli]MTW04079.1 efflux RND transporter periplasmic adaptor subunit [Pseudoduganella ginsengisoli]
MRDKLTPLFRFLLSAAVVGAALCAGKTAWTHYMESPWTRDGRVHADIISISADVAGMVASVPVHDNQLVHAGDILFTVDPARYRAALAQAEAALAAQQAEVRQRGRHAQRRARLDDDIVSAENREDAGDVADAATARLRAAQAARDLAKLNLERTVVRAPADGYVTNLQIHAGDYAAAGAARMALVDSASFYVIGYFEETRLPALRAGATAEIRLMGGGPALRGHIDSIARGITDRDASGPGLLADVHPTFNWVRLAQRVPVRIALDKTALPLVAGATCTVEIKGG